MYIDVVTIFNRYQDSLGDITWYPTVIKNVNLQVDKAAMIAKYGEQSNDTAALGIKYVVKGEGIFIEDKSYCFPKEWNVKESDELNEYITFKSGNDFDFFIEGEFDDSERIIDDDYPDGFFNAMKKEYDNVFAITSVAKYTTIPHFEIMGA